MADLNNTIVRGKLRVTEDINANGSITGNGSGLMNLNASNIGSGTLNVDRLADSGVTAGAYGDTTPQTPDYNTTFKVPSISVNAKGIVTAIGEHTVKIPASDNTWRGIQDNLTSDSTTDSLSAKQGKELKKLVDGKSNSGHTHTPSEAGAAAAHHLYHTWDNNTNYYDSFGGDNMFRIVTENMYADCFRFQASTVSNLEYYNGSSWTSWNFDLSNLFDGNARTGVSIPYANRKFRFQLTANGGWPTTALFMLQGTWFDDGGWPNGQKSSIIIETRANTSDAWSQKASFDLSGVEGMAGHTLSSLHTGNTLYRITIEIAPWTNTSKHCPLQRLCLFSNYNGGALETLSYTGTGNITTSKSISAGSFMTNGTLTANTLSTSTMVLPENSLHLKFGSGNDMVSTADFRYSNLGGAYLDMTGHLVLNEAGDHPNKPENKTGLPSVSYADYFNTGITAYGISASTSLPAAYELSFPGKSGTFLLDSDLVAEDMVEAVFSPSDKTYNSIPSGSLADSSNSILTVNSTSIDGSLNAGDRVAIKAFTGALGDNNTPICITNGGHLCPCTKYAGGTRVTLNGGTPSSGSDVSFYAPTAKGTSGYHLFWNGESTISPTASTYKNYTTNSSTKYYIAGWDSGTSTTSGNTPLKQMGQSIYMMGGSTGNLYASAFYAASDRRLKENIKDLDLNCLDLVNNINLREFSWKADEEHKPVIGAIAQELRQVLPEKYVHEFIGGQETENEYLSINDSKLVYLLIGAIQEQQKEIESLKVKIDSKIV